MFAIVLAALLVSAYNRLAGDSKDRWIRNNWQKPKDKRKHRQMRRAWKESSKRNGNNPK